jgi:hypothetical protein
LTKEQWFIKDSIKVFRSTALHIYALFPFLILLKGYVNGRIFRGVVLYLRDYMLYVKEDRKAQSGFELKWHTSYPILTDRFDAAGNIPRHYFWQDLWASRKVYESKVPKHYDMGSRLDGFIAHCLPFCEVVMLDIRPLHIQIKNLSFIQADCMDMSGIPAETLLSFSSLHAVEHFGLGRYGDPIDPLGFKRAIMEIQRVVKSGGSIYFSVPVGVERLEFNAHRIFNPETVIKLFGQCDLIEFSIVDDENTFHENVDPSLFSGLQYGGGLFHFRKRMNQQTVVA